MAWAGWLNAAWLAGCLPEAARFRRATRQVAATQQRLLFDILQRNQASEFGRRHAFHRMRSVDDFRAVVPLARAEDFAEPIDRIASGTDNVLTTERVLLLEPTSGSTGGEKLIPYTQTLRRQFQRAVAAWIAGIFHDYPAAMRGRAYWSISPAIPQRRSAGGLPIGFDDDSAYLGRFSQWALKRLLVVPSSNSRTNLAEHRRSTLLSLLSADDLALISVWSPTFLTALLAPLIHDADSMLANMPPSRRGRRISAIVRGRDSWAQKFQAIWPRLAVISCWTDAAAGQFVPAVRSLFPSVPIQSKGLIATEGVVTFPYGTRPECVLAIRSHFFEFETPDGSTRLAHELTRGSTYGVVLTTRGGLYRYRLGDLVEVVGFADQAPLLKFIGKSERTSDLVGEKLAEPFVRSAIERVCENLRVKSTFALLAPGRESPPRYTLYLQAPNLGELNGRFSQAIDVALSSNPHYGYAVGIGQLAPASVHVVPSSISAWEVYERRFLELGRKAGDIKPAFLDSWTGWGDLFGQK
jgi:hypothetical protein